ncbi:MAG: 6-bladed beta-propeller, partial [Tannerellaceae bacterium]
MLTLRHIPYFLPLLLLSFGCQQQVKLSQNEQIFLPWDFDKNRTIDDIIESVEAIPIEPNIEGFFSHINAVKIDSSGIYLSDRRKQVLLAFDHDGKFRCKFGSIGRAINYGEYINYRAYCIDDNHLYMVDNAVKKLFTFNKYNGDFISVKEMPFYAYDMEVLPDNRFAFVWCRHVKDDIKDDTSIRKITITDFNLKTLETLLQPSINDGIEEKSVYLTKINDKYSYHYFFTDTILLIDRNNFNNQVEYIMPVKNTIPNNKKIDNDIYDENRVMDGYNFLNGHISPIITDRYIVFALHGINNYGAFIYDINDKKYLFNKEANAEKFMFEPYFYYND